MNDDHDPFRVEADYLEDSNSVGDYVSEYKKEIAFVTTGTVLYATASLVANADEVNEVVSHFF